MVFSLFLQRVVGSGNSINKSTLTYPVLALGTVNRNPGKGGIDIHTFFLNVFILKRWTFSLNT